MALDEAALRRFVGRYAVDAPPIDLAIDWLDGRLHAVLPGQTARPMAATGPTSFRLTGIPVEVTLDFEARDGTVAAVSITQQGQTFRLVRQR